MKKIDIVFFGTPDFSVLSLKELHINKNIRVSLVVSMPDRAKGRGRILTSPPVIEYAKENKLNYYQTENINKDEKLKDILKNNKNDVFYVVAFAQFLSSFFLELPKLGCFNLHTSSLPKYRGAAPIQYALLNGDKNTGVSIQKMVKKMDAGNIVFKNNVKIENDETSSDLFKRLSKESAVATKMFFEKLTNQEKIVEIIQDESLVSYAPAIKKEDGHVNFKNENYESLANKLRAYHPWPGIYINVNNKRLKIFKIEKSDLKVNVGDLNTSFDQFVVGLKDISARLVEVQLEGKKRATDFEVINGLKNKHDHFEIT